jgi:hypothetical protein
MQTYCHRGPELIYILPHTDKPLQERQMALQETFELDAQRQRTPYPNELLATIKNARREKIVNKTRERERERRGEVLPCTIRRRRKGPPAHVLRTMTPEQQRMDKIARSVSEVGYVGLVKKQLGFKLRNPEAWKVEIGTEEQQEAAR